MTNSVLAFLNGGDHPIGLNGTTIRLIPKVRHPQLITLYRPIALCPILYKLAAKVVTNRMRSCMDDIMSEEQSAFVLGRLITDNVLVAFQSVYTIKRRKRGKNVACAVKLDMMIAYDRAEWDYLQSILLKLGSAINFVRLIDHEVRHFGSVLS